jgi:hypothetical protein
MRTPAHPLQPLVAALKECRTQDKTCSPKTLIEVWGNLRELNPEQGDQTTAAVMAALVLYDETGFARLLNEAERAQLLALSVTALERYLERAHPPNKLGKTIASAIKESS